eukprot:GFYU01005432.1.p1 GENE.GFYU01005432.1~~GFYU01005432.1.p1  ORF type:complete len:330 (-),score=44.62 GFYU01005432.1:74-976(-)
MSREQEMIREPQQVNLADRQSSEGDVSEDSNRMRGHRAIEQYTGTYGNCCTTARLQAISEDDRKLVASGRCFGCCCYSDEIYSRSEDDQNAFKADGEYGETGTLRFRDDLSGFAWSGFCAFGFMKRKGTLPYGHVSSLPYNPQDGTGGDGPLEIYVHPEDNVWKPNALPNAMPERLRENGLTDDVWGRWQAHFETTQEGRCGCCPTMMAHVLCPLIIPMVVLSHNNAQVNRKLQAFIDTVNEDLRRINTSFAAVYVEHQSEHSHTRTMHFAFTDNEREQLACYKGGKCCTEFSYIGPDSV